MIKEPLDHLLKQLKYLKEEGTCSIQLEKDTLDVLKETVQALSKLEAPEPTTQTVPPTPSNHRAQQTDQPIPLISLQQEPTHKSAKKKHESTTQDPYNKAIPIPPEETIQLPEGSKQEKWDYLKKKVLECPVCNKHIKPGKKVVFGVGSLDADIFFCGEAPGADEETQGEPFVGKAGQLLTKIIQATGLQRSDVYIGNIMNWRPEMPTPYGNRPPTVEEMRFCLPYLKAQIEIIQPKVIVALGSTAVTGLLGPDSKRRMGDIRGHWFEFEGFPLMVTFHPSYLLRNNTLKTKRAVWEDFLKVMEKVNLPISDKHRKFFT